MEKLQELKQLNYLRLEGVKGLVSMPCDFLIFYNGICYFIDTKETQKDKFYLSHKQTQSQIARMDKFSNHSICGFYVRFNDGDLEVQQDVFISLAVFQSGKKYVTIEDGMKLEFIKW